MDCRANPEVIKEDPTKTVAKNFLIICLRNILHEKTPVPRVNNSLADALEAYSPSIFKAAPTTVSGCGSAHITTTTLTTTLITNQSKEWLIMANQNVIDYSTFSKVTAITHKHYNSVREPESEYGSSATTRKCLARAVGRTSVRHFRCCESASD